MGEFMRKNILATLFVTITLVFTATIAWTKSYSDAGDKKVSCKIDYLSDKVDKTIEHGDTIIYYLKEIEKDE